MGNPVQNEDDERIDSMISLLKSFKEKLKDSDPSDDYFEYRVNQIFNCFINIQEELTIFLECWEKGDFTLSKEEENYKFELANVLAIYCNLRNSSDINDLIAGGDLSYSGGLNVGGDLNLTP